MVTKHAKIQAEIDSLASGVAAEMARRDKQRTLDLLSAEIRRLKTSLNLQD